MLNWQNIKDRFPYPLEIPTIFAVIQAEIDKHINQCVEYPFEVDVHAFMLAIRKQENGIAGVEFGIMHPQAVDTNLVIQAEWAMATIIKDTKRWHNNTLTCVKGKSKDDFVDWIEYFGTKYCCPSLHPNNKFWLPNVREFYKDFTLDFI